MVLNREHSVANALGMDPARFTLVLHISQNRHITVDKHYLVRLSVTIIT